MISTSNSNCKKGFTLIELLVVISIISLLSSIMYATLNTARENARMAANMQFDANILHGIGDQLVGEWKFDEGNGTAIDTSSFNNNGTVNGATWSATAGYNGKGAYQFNGSNSVTARLKGLNTNNITITAWIKPIDISSGLQGIIVARSGGMSGIVSYGNNDVRPVWHDAGYSTPTNLYLMQNKWNFVAMSVTPTKIILYVNGNSYTNPSSGPFSTANFDDPSNPIYIGRDSQQPGWPMYIDNVRVYTAPITSAQIQQLYADGLKTHQDLALKQ